MGEAMIADFFRTISEKIPYPGRPKNVPPIVRDVRTKSLTYLSERALCDLYDQAVRLEKEGIEGAFVEAGCALGGSAIVLAAAKSQGRPFYVFDVFSMIPPPSPKDGKDVHRRYEAIKSGMAKGLRGNKYYGYEEDLIEKVKGNFDRHSLPVGENHIHLVKGLFQETMKIEEKVALAHIDGDWYDSVMTCLQRITPHLIPGGVLVIDDYDCWSGCRTAVDEYFKDQKDRYRWIKKARLHIIRK